MMIGSENRRRRSLVSVYIFGGRMESPHFSFNSDHVVPYRSDDMEARLSMRVGMRLTSRTRYGWKKKQKFWGG